MTMKIHVTFSEKVLNDTQGFCAHVFCSLKSALQVNIGIIAGGSLLCGANCHQRSLCLSFLGSFQSRVVRDDYLQFIRGSY